MLHESGTGEPDPGTTVGGGESRDCWLHKLQHDLTHRLRVRVRAALDPDDVAGETALRAWVHFGSEPARPWSTVWSWSLTTASNLVVSRWRAQRRRVANNDIIGSRAPRDSLGNLGPIEGFDPWSGSWNPPGGTYFPNE